MVTASHNENGWTGVKMGIKKGLTHAPEEMKELKDITLNKKFINGKGKDKEIKNFQEIYKKDRFRLGLGDVVESYQEIAHRIGIDLK